MIVAHLPEHLVVELISQALLKSTRRQGLTLRLVCSKLPPASRRSVMMLTLTEAFNDSVLYAYFVLRIKTEESHLSGNTGHDIFIASHRLQASLRCGHDSAP